MAVSVFVEATENGIKDPVHAGGVGEHDP